MSTCDLSGPLVPVCPRLQRLRLCSCCMLYHTCNHRARRSSLAYDPCLPNAVAWGFPHVSRSFSQVSLSIKLFCAYSYSARLIAPLLKICSLGALYLVLLYNTSIAHPHPVPTARSAQQASVGCEEAEDAGRDRAAGGSRRRRSVYPQTRNECREVQRMSVGRYTLSRGAAAGLTSPAHERASEREREREQQHLMVCNSLCRPCVPPS